jgi:ferredoxin
MYNIFNLLCVGLLCIMCYMKPLCYICVESCPSNQIMYIYNYFCCFMHMFVVSQRLMVVYMSFFVSWLFLLLSCHTYGLHKSEINNVKENTKKPLFYGLFLPSARRPVYWFQNRFTGNTDWYTGFRFLKFKI